MIYHNLPGTPILERSRQIKALIRHGSVGLAGNKRLKLYGRLDCGSGKKMKCENRVFFADEQEAVGAGYRPCGHCLKEKYHAWKNGV